MTPKQKVLSIRLAKLISKNYVYAKNLGLEVKSKVDKKQRRKTNEHYSLNDN